MKKPVQGELLRLAVNPGWSDSWTQGALYQLLGNPVELPGRDGLQAIVLNDENEVDHRALSDFISVE